MINRVSSAYNNTYNYQIERPQRQDPDTYAQNYAKRNGLSIDEAKTQLKAKYGDPESQQVSFGNQINFGNMDFSNFNLSVNEEDIEGIKESNPLTDAFKRFGNTITDFFKRTGSQEKVDNNNKENQNPNGLTPEEQELLEAGVPLEVIQEGDNAIMNFLQDNNIAGYTEKKDINPFA